MLISFFIFIMGLAVGSFLNVLAVRWSRNESIWGRSHCPHCFKTLRWFELFPVISFILLRGRCRYCQQKISWQYPLIETTTGLLFLLIFNFQFADGATSEIVAGSFLTFNLIYYLFIVSCLIAIFIADFKYYLIPDQLIVMVVGATIFYRLNLVAGSWSNLWYPLRWQGHDLVSALMAALVAGGFFFFLAYFSSGAWMGGGDVKLAFAMGLALGWPQILAALFLAFWAGALVGIILVATKQSGWKSEIPFGTFLSVATFIILMWGDGLLKWWETLWF